MDKREQINNALSAHSLWKFKLNDAIKSGKTDFDVDNLRQDCQCEFGEWLKSNSFSTSERQSDQYRYILKLHAEFHKTAAEVCKLVNTNKIVEAKVIMSIGGAYNSLSSQLTNEMVKWRDSIKQ